MFKTVAFFELFEKLLTKARKPQLLFITQMYFSLIPGT